MYQKKSRRKWDSMHQLEKLKYFFNVTSSFFTHGIVKEKVI